jgi:hypothetical protein
MLRLLRGSLPPPMIAAELWLSPNTTKAHTQVISPARRLYRDDAITRGQETGIL